MDPAYHVPECFGLARSAQNVKFRPSKAISGLALAGVGTTRPPRPGTRGAGDHNSDVPPRSGGVVTNSAERSEHQNEAGKPHHRDCVWPTGFAYGLILVAVWPSGLAFGVA